MRYKESEVYIERDKNKEREREREIIVTNASDGQRHLMPFSKCWFEFDGGRGNGPEGVADVLVY